MEFFQVQSAPAIRLWAENAVNAHIIADALGVKIFPVQPLTDTLYAVTKDSLPINYDFDWGVATRGKEKAYMFFLQKGYDVEIVFAKKRKKYQKSERALTKRQIAKEMIGLVVLARKARGWSQEDLARAVGTSRNTIWAYEKGHGMPHCIDKIYKALQLNTTKRDYKGITDKGGK